MSWITGKGFAGSRLAISARATLLLDRQLGRWAVCHHVPYTTRSTAHTAHCRLWAGCCHTHICDDQYVPIHGIAQRLMVE
jgi:hypothetical protein